MLTKLYILLLGSLGILARYYCGLWFEKFFPSIWPLATFSINILGSFLIGIIYVFGMESAAISFELRLGLMVGLLGGFTTFSAFSLEAVRLFETLGIFYALCYLFFTPVFGFLSALLGIVLARRYS